MEALDILREKGVKRVGPYRVTRTMGSTVSACLATPFQIKGVNYSISSACATSAHCIGTAVEQIQLEQYRNNSAKVIAIWLAGRTPIWWLVPVYCLNTVWPSGTA